MDTENKCPCGSGNSYETCCKPYHDGKIAENALILMRSRYSAYALNLPDYIIKTTHPASPQYSENIFSWRRNISRFCTHSQFNKLEVLDFKEKGDLATVTFTVTMKQNKEDATFTEKSYFDKFKNRWMYRSGQLEEGRVPELVEPGELRILPFTYYGNPILRRKADPVLEITDDLKKLVESMIETMRASDGIGLAAPQINQSIRLFIALEHIENEDGSLEEGEILVLINPKLSSPSQKTWIEGEGCLSIPTIRGEIERPHSINVEYMDLEGKIVQRRFSGWTAKIIMHENDHINGVLFIDRLSKDERAKLEPILKNLQNRIEGV